MQPKIGIALDNLGPSQVAYTAIYQGNIFASMGYKNNINLFFLEQKVPCIHPIFGRFHAADSVSFDGLIISTSLTSLEGVKKAHRANHYLYLQDVDIIRGWTDKNKHDNLINSVDKVIFRSEEHYNLYKEYGYKLSKNIIKDFDINQILEIYYAQEN